MSEDCLYLNVFAAPNVTDELQPVMLWIHGGGFNGGDAVQGHGLFNGSGLVESQGVTVVTVDYRVNAFGFLGSQHLRDADGSTGNFGMQDQRAAMVWVQRYIHLFGGDKDKVAIFGCSAGAASVSVQYVLRRTFEQRLFRAAIAESGAFAQWASKPMHVAEAVFANFAGNLGCNVTDLDCMRAKNATAIEAATAGVIPKVSSAFHISTQ
jgi:carboxylesterase type B